MGDGENGLAAMIFVVAAVMVVAGFAFCLWLGWLFARRLKFRRGATVALASAAGVIGIGLGATAVIATFLESTWSPPPRLRIAVPPGFKPHWVILLEDPAAPTALVWQGLHAPFHSLSAAVAVPAGGIVRVRSLANIADHGDLLIEWSDGGSSTGFASGSAPASAHALGYVAYERPSGAHPADDMFPDGERLAAYIRSHGG